MIKNAICGNELTVLNNLYGDPLIYTLLREDETINGFLGELYRRGGENDLSALLSEIIIKDENALSLNAARGQEISEYVKKAFFRDVKTIFIYAENAAKCGGFNLGAAKYGLQRGEACFDDLVKFYRGHGYGVYIDNVAFNYDGEKLIPIKNVAKTRLCDLKDYESEKKSLMFNVENFLNGLPFGDTLLYGDRGTGKSSTVQAILNEYSQKGLRLIQFDKKFLGELPKVRNVVSGNPLKFIIFIDDLSLAQNDEDISAFKAALEGAVSRSSNSMVIATSNRRHIVKESFADRQSDVHPEDALQDVISLSDRFALTIMFSSTGKTEYLSIVKQIAEDGSFYTEELLQLAERWALTRGGRSPRAARQFCDYALACVKRGVKIDF